MILVLLGTNELPFTRLVTEVERLKRSSVITEAVIVQNGKTPYESDLLDLRPFMSYEELDRLYDEARLIITHAGTGSIITGVKKGKKVIAVARLAKYREHVDDHQLQIVEEFTQSGHILEWKDGEPLEAVLRKAESFKPSPFQSGLSRILALIEAFIERHG